MRLDCDLQQNETQDAVTIVKLCIESFKSLVHKLLFSSSATTEVLTDGVESFAERLNEAAKLFPSAIVVPSKPAHLDEAVWFKMGLIILMTNLRVDREEKRAPLLCLMRQFFDSLVTTLSARITYFCLEKEKPPIEVQSENSSDSSGSENRKSRENTPEFSPQRRPVRRRKRGRVAHLLDNQLSDLSELEETALRTIGVLDISDSDSSNSSYESSGGALSSPQSVREGRNDHLFNLKTTKEAGLQAEGYSETSPFSLPLQQLYHHSPIQTFKVLCDFFAANTSVFQECKFSTQSLQSLADLLNLCVKIESETFTDENWKLTFLKRPLDPEWQQRIPLPVDWNLLQFPYFLKVQSSMDFSTNQRTVCKADTSFICLQRVISFGITVSMLNPHLIEFDSEIAKFKSLPQPPQSSSSSRERKPPAGRSRGKSGYSCRR